MTTLVAHPNVSKIPTQTFVESEFVDETENFDTFPPPPNTPKILTQTVDEFVEQEIAERGFSDKSEYFAKLAEEEHVRKIWAYYEKEVMNAIESDTWIPYTPDFWDKIHEDIEQRLQAQQAGQ
jgi:hypothetical protein